MDAQHHRASIRTGSILTARRGGTTFAVIRGMRSGMGCDIQWEVPGVIWRAGYVCDALFRGVEQSWTWPDFHNNLIVIGIMPCNPQDGGYPNWWSRENEY